MVDFKNETRKRCRHCKMKLPEPTSNERQAFCKPAGVQDPVVTKGGIHPLP